MPFTMLVVLMQSKLAVKNMASELIWMRILIKVDLGVQ